MKLNRYLFLLLVLLLLLSACGKPESSHPNPGVSAVPGESPVPAADMRYLRYDVMEEAQFDLSYEDHSFTETELILLGQRKDATLLLRVLLAGGDATELSLDKPYKQVAAGPDCLWLGDGMQVDRLTPDGQQTLSLTFPEMIEDLLCDEMGRLYVAHRNSLTLVSNAGETESISLPKGFTGGSLVRLGSGEIAVFASRIKGEVERFQRISGGMFQPMDTGDTNIGVLAHGNSAADFYYVEWSYSRRLGEAAQVFRFSGGASTPIFDLAGTRREGQIQGLNVAGTDAFLLYEGEDGVGILRFSPTEEEKKILTVARLSNNDQVTMLIARFNRENPEYYLSTRHYYGMVADEQLEQLELDILAGDRPDILDTMSTTIEVYGAKGLLRDLYPMLDADQTISREDFVPSILHALESESGALYRLWPVFTLFTCAEPAIYVGNAESWTLEDMYRICEEYPDLTLYGNYGMLREQVDFTLPGVMDRFADLETGKMSFNSAGFVEYLTFMQKMIQRARDYAGGDFLLYVNLFESSDDFARGITSAETAGLKFTGYPCSGGTGHYCSGLYSFSIFDGTGNEEDAWVFLRWLLSEEVQESLEGIPMRQCLLEAQLEKLKDGIPEKTVTQFVDPVGAAAGTNTETVTYTLPAVPPPTDEQMATIRRLLEGVEGVHEETITHPCYYIVWEECTKLFNGAKSPEDTAKAIQERLSIFLAERTP